MTNKSLETPRKPPPTTRFIKAMGQGLHAHFDDAVENDVPGDFLRTLKQADRRQLIQPKAHDDKH
jgi:hypothetical protein